jgi:hypothetical protein
MRAGTGKLTPPLESLDDSSPRELVGSEKAESIPESLLRSSRRQASSATTLRDSNVGTIHTALLSPRSASSGEAPMHKAAGRFSEPNDEVKQDYILANTYAATERQQSSGRTPSTYDKMTHGGSGSEDESLKPKPLAIDRNGNGKSARKQARKESIASGWWGALASVINRPSAVYDPSNVV